MSPTSVPLLLGHRISLFIIAEISAVSASAVQAAVTFVLAPITVTFVWAQATNGDPKSLSYSFSQPVTVLVGFLFDRCTKRYSEFVQLCWHNPPFIATVFAEGFYLSSDFLNFLVLYAYTRPDLLPGPSDNPDKHTVLSEFAQPKRSSSSTTPCNMWSTRFPSSLASSASVGHKSADPGFTPMVFKFRLRMTT
ncbi:hypothetical protein EDB83DRAFT_2518452 [Lactarius deliciosus]|nr:hypothetical protein EDB83DRAFT_2518452 [Lactarius deliciosus]